MTFDIYTYGSGSYVVEALHSVKMFMGSNSYSTLARIAGLIGLLWVLLAALRNKSGGTIQADWSWLLFFMFFYVGLIVPKVDIIVNDPIDPPTTASPVVTNVPLGIGAIAYLTTTIGHGLVQKYETYITIPGDQKYSQNGMLFGANVMRSFGEMEFPDARFSSDVNIFIAHCMFPQITAGSLSLDAMATSSDLWDYLKNNAQTNRWVNFQDGVIRTCREASDDLNTRMNPQVNTAAGQAGQKLWPTKNLSSAQAAFLSSAGGTTATDFIGITQSGADLTRQSMMIRAVSGALEGASIDSDNQSMAQAVFQAKAEAQQRNTYITMGNTASRTLPVMKAVMEAISYAIAPLVFLFVLMPGGLVAFGQYAMFMVWLQMWPILYAIINSIMYWYGSQSSMNSALLSDGTHGLTMESMNSVFAVNADMVALTGYMAISIPMISYMLVKGGMSAGGSIYSSMMQPANSAATTAATEQTNGAMTMNSLTMDNSSWGNSSSLSYSRGGWSEKSNRVFEDRMGNTRTVAADGEHRATNELKSSYAVTTSVDTSRMESARESLSNAQSRMSSVKESLSDSVSSARSQVTSFLQEMAKGEDSGNSYNYGEAGSAGDTLKTAVGAMRNLMHGAGNTSESAVTDASTGTAGISANMGVNGGVTGSTGLGGGGSDSLRAKAGVEGGVNGRLDQAWSHQESEKQAAQTQMQAQKTLQNVLSDEGMKSFAAKWGEDKTFRDFVSSRFASSDQLSSSLQTVLTNARAFEQAKADVSTHQSSYDSAAQSSVSVSTDQLYNPAQEARISSGASVADGLAAMRQAAGVSAVDNGNLSDRARSEGIAPAGSIDQTVSNAVNNGDATVRRDNHSNTGSLRDQQNREGLLPGGHVGNDVAGVVDSKNAQLGEDYAATRQVLSNKEAAAEMKTDANKYSKSQLAWANDTLNDTVQEPLRVPGVGGKEDHVGEKQATMDDAMRGGSLSGMSAMPSAVGGAIAEGREKAGDKAESEASRPVMPGMAGAAYDGKDSKPMDSSQQYTPGTDPTKRDQYGTDNTEKKNESGGDGLWGMTKDALDKAIGVVIPAASASETPYPAHGGGVVNQSLPPEAKALLDTIAGTESPGYNVMYRGETFSSYADHPRQYIPILTGPNAGDTSSAAGRYQFLASTWDEQSEKLGLRDFSPASQDAAAWNLAKQDYSAKTGRDLLEDLRSGDAGSIAKVGSVLSSTWTSLPSGIEATTNGSKFTKAFRGNLSSYG